MVLVTRLCIEMENMSVSAVIGVMVMDAEGKSLLYINAYKIVYKFLCLVLLIVKEVAYLTFKLIFHNTLTLFSLIVKSRSDHFLEPTRL